MGVLLKVMIWGGLLLAAINLLALWLTSGGPAPDTGAGSVVPAGSPVMIWFGLIAAAAGMIFDRWTRAR